jgi:hypothetical protein
MSKNTLKKVFLEPPEPPDKNTQKKYKHNKVYCENILMKHFVY